jgi:hypothetical protein
MAENPARTQLMHDLRSQLNNISMNAELAKLELTTQAPSQSIELNSADSLACLDTIRAACAACNEILEALASLSCDEGEGPTTQDSSA